MEQIFGKNRDSMERIFGKNGDLTELIFGKTAIRQIVIRQIFITPNWWRLLNISTLFLPITCLKFEMCKTNKESSRLAFFPQYERFQLNLDLKYQEDVSQVSLN